MMTRNELQALRMGDRVRHDYYGNVFVVVSEPPVPIVACTVTIMHPAEWSYSHGEPVQEITCLKPGDQVVSALRLTYTVVLTQATRAIAIRVEEMEDPDDWTLIT